MTFNDLVFSTLIALLEPLVLLVSTCSFSTLPIVLPLPPLLLILPLILPHMWLQLVTIFLIESILHFCPLCFLGNNYNEEGSPSTSVEDSHV